MSALIILSLLGSTVSLVRITEVSRTLDAINRVDVPLGRLFAQMQTDAEVFGREMDRGLGASHWHSAKNGVDARWRPHPIPRWIEDVLESEVARVRELLAANGDWASPEARARWMDWADGIQASLANLRVDGQKLYAALEQNNSEEALRIEPRWNEALEDWRHKLQWGANEYERALRDEFTRAESRVSQLQTGLEVILLVVISLSLLLLWLGERALRPLAELTRLAREITVRGLTREDKAALGDVRAGGLGREDEVSQLSREFHHMATALLERETTVETQNRKLEEQNRKLRDMSALQERLRTAEGLAAVGRMSAQVAHEVRNPLHSIGLEAEMAAESAGKLGNPALKQSLQSILSSVDRLEKITENYLKLSRISAGARAPVDLGEVLETVLATYASAFEMQGVSVDWSREKGALEVLGDRALLEQAVGNLIRNALQAVEGVPTRDGQGAEIRCALGRAESGRVWLRVLDNGPGVPLEERARLFTPFFTTRAQGTGLGLSFVKRVVEEQGGSVALVGSLRGACFELAMPEWTREKSEETSLEPNAGGIA